MGGARGIALKFAQMIALRFARAFAMKLRNNLSSRVACAYPSQRTAAAAEAPIRCGAAAFFSQKGRLWEGRVGDILILRDTNYNELE